MTSPAAAGSADDLPDYAPVPQSSLGVALNDQGYYIGRVERNLYWVTDGVYQSAFLTTSDGVVLFDAPPSIGHNPRRAVDEIAATEGVSNKVTHLVYSHHHADHAAAASLFDDAVRVGHEETRRLLLRDNDPSRPLPEVTFADRYTLEVPESGLSSPGTAPTIRRTTSTFTSLTTTRSSTSSTPAGCLSTTPTSARMYPATSRPPATALNYPWRHFICGHLGRLATRDDVAVHQQYIADTEASAREALASVDPTPYYMRYRENVWAW